MRKKREKKRGKEEKWVGAGRWKEFICESIIRASRAERFKRKERIVWWEEGKVRSLHPSERKITSLFLIPLSELQR